MKSEHNYKNILIYRIGHLGDTIVTLPAFWRIRKKFPAAKLTLLTNVDEKNTNYVTAKNILPERGLFDDYLGYDNSAKSFGKIKVFAKLFLKLRSERFDALYYLSFRNRTDIQIDRDVKFFNLAGIKNIHGIEYLKKNRLNFEEPRPLPEVEPEYEFLLNCLDDKSQVEEYKIKFDLNLTDSEMTFAVNWLSKNCGDYLKSNKLIAVAPGSKWSSKLWYEGSYLQVIERLIKEFDVFPVIFGGREDFETGERIISKLDRGANAAGKFSIRESSAALKNCIFYLGNDTGTMHLAAAVNVPCIAIFAATDYKGRWYPFGDNNRIFRKFVDCEGCHSPKCFNDHLCLKLISVEEVFSACKNVLISERDKK